MNIKLLLDANLSWRSISVLRNHFEDCFHVDSIGLKIPAKDAEIWEYAKLHDLLIVTNDEDFFNLALLKGFPPKIVLLKTGNQNRKFIEDLLVSQKPQIVDFLLSNEYGILEILMEL